MIRHARVLAVLLAAACSPKGDPERNAADSTVVVDSAAVAPATDGKAPPVIGRDSAFGPRYMVDSTGKLIPLPIKKP